MAAPQKHSSIGLALRAAEIGFYTAWDSLLRPMARHGDDVPADIERVTNAWLTAALCGNTVGARVSGHDLGPRSSGTTVRQRITLRYEGAPGNADLPATVFAKSSPRFFNRMALTMTGTIETEALFYRHIRPLLSLEAPRGYHSAYDLRTGRSIHLLEDLVATKSATFCSPAMTISR